jgi:nucleoside phosphorylase
VSNVDVLVVAPHAPELEGLGSVLGKSLSADVSGVRVTAKSVGLGMPGVSGGATARIEAFHPRALVLMGTCACYPGRNLAPGRVVVVERVVIGDAAVLRGWSNFPEPMAGQVAIHAGLLSGLAGPGVRRVSVASTLSVTADVTLAAELAAQLNCDVEHHEAFGIALACAPYQLPFAAVLGVSHEIGPQARETWRVTHRAAAHAAASLVGAWLRSGAVGVPHAV